MAPKGAMKRKGCPDDSSDVEVVEKPLTFVRPVSCLFSVAFQQRFLLTSSNSAGGVS